MALPPPPVGWHRFLVKSKFGTGRDFAVFDMAEHQAYYIDGKMGMRPKAEIKDAADKVVYRVRGQMFGIPKRMHITDGEGNEVADLTAKAFSPIKSRMTLRLRQGAVWTLEGTLIEKEYSIAVGARPVATITQKWVTIRDAYTLDVAEGIDPALTLAVLWAVDRWVERD